MAIINVSLKLNGHTGICLSSILHHSVLIILQMFIDTGYQDTKQICVSISYVTDISPSNLSTLRLSFKLLS